MLHALGFKKTNSFFFLLTLLIFEWIVFSGSFDAFLITFAVFASFLICYFYTKHSLVYCRFCIFGFKLFFVYVTWIFIQVLSSAFATCKEIYKSNAPDKKGLILAFDIKKYKSPTLVTLIANSVTLTPGTASLLIKDKKIYVHCLRKDFFAGVKDISIMLEKL